MFFAPLQCSPSSASTTSHISPLALSPLPPLCEDHCSASGILQKPSEWPSVASFQAPTCSSQSGIERQMRDHYNTLASDHLCASSLAGSQYLLETVRGTTPSYLPTHFSSRLMQLLLLHFSQTIQCLPKYHMPIPIYEALCLTFHLRKHPPFSIMSVHLAMSALTTQLFV